MKKCKKMQNERGRGICYMMEEMIGNSEGYGKIEIKS
jgi:hypothetical protein